MAMQTLNFKPLDGVLDTNARWHSPKICIKEEEWETIILRIKEWVYYIY